MKIALDMQSRQTSGSRERGIGRYSLSLAKAMLEVGGKHEFIVVANAGLGALDLIRDDFGFAPGAPEFMTFSSLSNTRASEYANGWRQRASELIRENFLHELRVDYVHASSLFEGFSDDAVTSISGDRRHFLEAATLYDLIPYAHPDIYLKNPAVRDWYYGKIGHLRRADLLLAISDFSAHDAVSRLGLFEGSVASISGAADPHFMQIRMEGGRRDALLQRYGLSRFIMYTGGIDHRKNIENLIAAYALLPEPLKECFQLAIVCKVQPAEHAKLMALARANGLAADRLVMTGFVSEEDLVGLYNTCDLFVFPSWYEGFGLPALEAMQCGAPVIAANCSSLPEVVGRKDALFDPHNTQEIASSMARVLLDEALQQDLRAHGIQRARRFTWQSSAGKALDAIEESHERRRSFVLAGRSQVSVPDTRPRLAFVSPLPSDRSGIAVYSAELLPFLERYYRITLVNPEGTTDDSYLQANMQVRSVEWFRRRADQFDRVIYQFGNSSFHSHMFDLLEKVPGVVVLHDFWLSGIVSHMDLSGQRQGFWDRELQFSHGWNALLARRTIGDEAARAMFPANGKVVEGATGLIVHSNKALGLLERWFGVDVRDKATCIQHLRVIPAEQDKVDALKRLGYAPGARLICSFGFIDATKHSLAIVDAFLESALAVDPHVKLVLVGANPQTDYGESIRERVERSGGKVSFTGFVDQEEYKLYLGAAEVAVQLRAGSRGETSGAALDCLAHGSALLINRNNAFVEIPASAVQTLPAEFELAQLTAALEDAMVASQARAGRIARGFEHLRQNCDPVQVARLYHDSIEAFQNSSERLSAARACRELVDIECKITPENDDLDAAAQAIRRNLRLPSGLPPLFVDAALGEALGTEALLAAESVADGGARARVVELVELTTAGFTLARRRMLELLGLSGDLLADVTTTVPTNSVWLLDVGALHGSVCEQETVRVLLQPFQSITERIWFHCDESWLAAPSMLLLQEAARVAEGFLVANQADADLLAVWLDLALSSVGRSATRVAWPKGEGSIAGCLPSLLAAEAGAGLSERQVLACPARIWGAGCPELGSQTGRLDGDVLRSTGQAGFLVFGPYVSVAPGNYMLRIYGRAQAAYPSNAWYDVVAARGHRQVLEPVTMAGVRQGLLVEQPLVLVSAVDDLEIRIWVGEGEALDFFAFALVDD